MEFERQHSAWIAASVITVGCFVGATAYTQDRLARLDTLSATIETVAVPSIEYLSRAAVRLTRLNQLLDELAIPAARHESAVAAAREELGALRRDVDQYFQLPPLPGERDFWAQLRPAVDRAVLLSTDVIKERGEEDVAAAAREAPHAADADDAVDAALAAVSATLAFDVRQSEAMARDVRAVRQSTLRMIIELDAFATLIAVIAVFVAYRAARRHDRLIGEHNTLMSARVTELDRFAGRVAHDVLSPLGVIAMALPLLEQSCDHHGRVYVERSRRALHRVKELVDDLLTFARSGAHPDGSHGCPAHDVVADVAADCADALKEHDIDLRIEIPQPISLPCASGVAASIVQNLLRNAIKYMGASPLRRIVVRAFAAGRLARLEVEDTGPGIPAEIQTTLFDPFVRGPSERASGTGLGLATVKRLVESHGGRVGCQSGSDGGALFWAELPLQVSGVEPAGARDDPGRQ